MSDSNIKWQDLRQRIRQFNKTASESSNFYLPHFFKFSNSNDSVKLYFLGVPNGQTQFTLFNTDFPEKVCVDSPGRSDNLSWKQCWTSDAQPRSNRPLNREQELLGERMRVRTSGIMSYNLTRHVNASDGSKFNQLIFLSGNRLHVFRDDKTKESFPQELSTKSEGCILNPVTCPLNADLVCFVQNGDIFVKLGLQEEVQLTSLNSGSSGVSCLSAGMPSYVVQEEFDRYIGYWWRPCAKKDGDVIKYQILYEMVDESKVDVLNIVSYNTLGSTVDQYRYPRPGTKNAVSDLKIVELTCTDNQILDVQHLQMSKALHTLFPDMEYLLNAGWLSDGSSIYVEMTNRLQSVKKMFMIPLEKFTCSYFTSRIESMETNEIKRPIYLIKEETSEFWIHTNELLHFLPSHNPLLISFLVGSETSGYLHIHHFTVDLADTLPCSNYEDVHIPKHSSETPVTSGDWEVSLRQMWVDEREKLLYFMAYKDTPLESHLYVASFDQSKSFAEPIRLTNLGFSHTVEMDEDCEYFVTTFSSVSEPHSCVLYSISKVKILGEIHLKADVLGTLLYPVTKKSLAIAELFDYKSSSGHIFYGMLFPPETVEVPPEGKYPVVLNVYGGPHVQQVTNSYTVNRHIVSHKLAHFGFAVVIIDGRGSARRGVKFEGHLKKKLGMVEIDDQIEVLHHISKKYHYLNLDRVAIKGWSYGGYLSLMGIANRPDIFKVAISGAPVTSWQLYDTAYTERFLGLPSTDADAYTKSSVVELASKFPDEENKLLIIHGLMDENVHFYHTSSLVDALIKASKPYVLQTYPRERHGIRNPESHDHYVAVVLSFLLRNL